MASTDPQLLAVLLITHSRSGTKLVCHYPPEPQLPHQSGLTHLPWVGHPILGVSEENLERLLFPGRWSDLKRFEVSLNGVAFVGRPVYTKPDDEWNKARSRGEQQVDNETAKLVTPPGSEHSGQNKTVEGGSNTHLGVTITEPTPIKPGRDSTHVPESLGSYGGPSLGTSMNSNASSGVSSEPLMAFHVVLVLSAQSAVDPSPGIRQMYEQVARKLSKALNYCQKKANYVSIESHRLAQMRVKAKQERTSAKLLCEDMAKNSELAWALQEIYEKISSGSTANIQLNGVPLSLQLRNEVQVQNGDIDPHQAILLLEDKDVLLRDLMHPDATPLAYFIREHTPTKSLQKLAVRLVMPLVDILDVAKHLIRWQKARLITPLHVRNTYVVGKEAPLADLQSHTQDYAKRFTALPSLPQMLRLLSGRPVKYGLLIVSRDHRGPYMDILAYLHRHQFVEPLKTSGWLQAPPSASKTPHKPANSNKNTRPLSVTSLLSPQLRPQSDDDAASISSERTAIPVSIAGALEKSESAINIPKLSERGEGAEEAATRMVKDPLRATGEDLLCLQHILNAIEDPELRRRLPSLYPYFNGEAIFEDIGAQEGLKRSTLDAWLDWLQDRGFLLSFRHL
jgi:nitrogen permease regulator 3-like protein